MSPSLSQQQTSAVLLGLSTVLCAALTFGYLWPRKKKTHESSFPALVGNTPMIKLESLSVASGCTILAKCEFMNPGGSSKDRVAKGIIEAAEAAGHLKNQKETDKDPTNNTTAHPPPRITIVEGTSGSTGISLALMCRARGYACVIIMPDDQASEKYALLKTFGATVELVKPASIVSASHYVNVARRRALEIPGGFFANQFENRANFQTHYETTGREIWQQTHGQVDAFVMSAGTGGTIAGVSRFLKDQSPHVQVILADPPGSSLYHKVRHNVCYSHQQSEQSARRHRYDTVTEGIGADRLTDNFLAASIDHAVRVSDRESVEMSRYLLREEGLFVGSSSALNCVGAMRVAATLPPGSTIVTILCDSGHRSLTKFWNDAVLAKDWNLKVTATGLEFLQPTD